MHSLLALVFLAAATSSSTAIYMPLREYSGSTFFDAWDYWGNVDNTTWGNVTYLNQANATSTTLTPQPLTYVDGNGHAIIRVDNTTNIPAATLVNRNSIRITTQDSYGVNNLIIIDINHLPYGCSVWPSFWTLGTGKVWPQAGEIDIIEGINLQTNNQMALHTEPGCVQAANTGQTGHTIETDCSTDRGCIVAESQANSFGSGFANAGGGVFATQIDVSGVYIWFWSRPNIPASIANATSTSNIDTTTFGTPSASYPASGCNFTEFFGPQQLVLDTTLCGDWAGVASIYAETCSGNCISSNIIGPGNPTYNNAYWDINYIRTYVVEADASSSSSAAASAPSSNPTTVAIVTTVEGSVTAVSSASATTTTGTQGNAAVRLGDSMTSLLKSFGAASIFYVIVSGLI